MRWLSATDDWFSLSCKSPSRCWRLERVRGNRDKKSATPSRIFPTNSSAGAGLDKDQERNQTNSHSVHT